MKPHIPINLAKLNNHEVVKRLNAGDAYSFIVPDLITTEHPTDENALMVLVPGDSFFRKYPGEAHGRVFRIVQITDNGDTFTYETVFDGFNVISEARGYLVSMLAAE